MKELDHTWFMRRAIEVAKRGWGDTHPNPLVGALIAGLATATERLAADAPAVPEAGGAHGFEGGFIVAGQAEEGRGLERGHVQAVDAAVAAEEGACMLAAAPRGVAQPGLER